MQDVGDDLGRILVTMSIRAIVGSSTPSLPKSAAPNGCWRLPGCIGPTSRGVLAVLLVGSDLAITEHSGGGTVAPTFSAIGHQIFLSDVEGRAALRVSVGSHHL
jgi:hypothetical protein